MSLITGHEKLTQESTKPGLNFPTPPNSGNNPNSSCDNSVLDLNPIRLQALENFFVNALEKKIEGRDDLFFTIVNEFQRAKEVEKMDVTRIYTWLLVFSKRISLLGPGCEALISKVLGIRWFQQNEEFIRVFYKFVIHLVSAHPIFVFQVVNMATVYFTDTKKDDTKSADTLRMIHSLLKEVLLHVPTSSTTLCNGLIKKLPTKWAPVEAHVSYCENLLLVTRYIPILRDQLLTALVTRILELDTEVQIEIDELKLLVEKDNEEGLFEMEVDEPSDSEDEMDGDIPLASKRHTTIKEINKLVEKLDGILVPFFGYLASFDYSSELGFSLFHHMLHVFTTVTLRTFKSRHTQFIMFYLCSLNPRFADAFLGVLFDVLDSPSPRITRISAAAYISSFTSRAKWLTDEQVRRVASLLVSWLVNYVDNLPTSENRLDVKRHALFYSLTQAILYLFCFRWQSFRSQGPQGMYWDPTISPLRHLLHSSLRPLKVCNKRLTEQFALLCQNLDFMYCYSIMEEDTKFSLKLNDVEQNNLDIFCPFDPYQLEGTSHLFDNSYISWQEACELPDNINSSKSLSINKNPIFQKNSKSYSGDSDADSSDIEIGIKSTLVGVSLSPITGFISPK